MCRQDIKHIYRADRVRKRYCGKKNIDESLTYVLQFRYSDNRTDETLEEYVYKMMDGFQVDSKRDERLDRVYPAHERAGGTKAGILRRLYRWLS
jgi:hypothetical protein